MRKIERLRIEALCACKNRNHVMGKFRYTSNYLNKYADCVHCGMRVWITPNPQPNDCEITGEAVALNCRPSLTIERDGFDPIKLTAKQNAALCRVYCRDVSVSPSYEVFLKGVNVAIGCQGAVIVEWKGMWLVVEPDGYTHS